MRKREKYGPRQEIPVKICDPELGLTFGEALQRSRGGWSNRSPRSAGKTEAEIILENILTFFNLVFVVLAAVLLLGGSSITNCTFMGVVVCNIAIGCVQEIRAKRAVDKLSLMVKKPVRCIRDGKMLELMPEELVRDDVVEFLAGDPVCADGVVCRGQAYVNESLITGEADNIEKTEGSLLKSGSFLVAGKVRARLTEVGPDAYAARLAAEAKKDPHAAKSGMMLSLDRLIRVAGIVLIPVGLVLFHQEFQVLKLGLTKSVEGTVAALVGMIPEGLYILTSIAMAASALKLAKDRVLVQDMNCIESLARVDVLCVDKTGTITEPRMKVEQLIPLSGSDEEYIKDILAAMYRSREPENETDRAVASMTDRESGWELLKHVPFTSASKWTGCQFREQGAFLAGAPEVIMGSRFPEIGDTVRFWSEEGCRVLLLASFSGELTQGKPEKEKITPLALLILANPIRKQAKEIFDYFARQGVAIRVISGDNPRTVSAVARRAGIENAARYVDSSELVTEEDYEEAVKRYTVFGRVKPEQKKKLIEALQKAGHTVAMTGDGVNDVLAMKQSDCSIAMASGARAASQVASLVLLDSDFAAMPAIVDEGRRVINNIQRSASLYLVKNIFSMLLALISLVTDQPYPFEPLQLTVISCFTIGIPSFFLAMEPNYERVEGTFLRGVLRRAFPGGVTDVGLILAIQYLAPRFGVLPHQIGPVCTAVLGLVGLMVLFSVSRPFGIYRRIIWCAMAAGLVCCFLLFGGFFGLRIGGAGQWRLLVMMLAAAPVMFVLTQRAFDWGDKVYRKLRKGGMAAGC